jgi:ATP-dependent Clp protease protease subunit
VIIGQAHAGKTFEMIEKDSDRDNWMTATEAKEYGLWMSTDSQ